MQTFHKKYTIKEWLCELKVQVAEIGKISPFFGIWFIADIIEFMGKCISEENFDSRGKRNSKNHFDRAIKSLSAFEDYRRYDNLYYKLRCGLTHGMRPEDKFEIKSTGLNEYNPEKECVSFERLNSDFSKAVVELFNMTESHIINRLNMHYVEIIEKNGNAVTGSTANDVIIK